jgi:hypothetical protein
MSARQVKDAEEQVRQKRPLWVCKFKVEGAPCGQLFRTRNLLSSHKDEMRHRHDGHALAAAARAQVGAMAAAGVPVVAAAPAVPPQAPQAPQAAAAPPVPPQAAAAPPQEAAASDSGSSDSSDEGEEGKDYMWFVAGRFHQMHPAESRVGRGSSIAVGVP